MNAASVKEIKSTLTQMPNTELVELCMRLIKFKKENKELASYLLFDVDDEPGYVANVKAALLVLFDDVHRTNPYFAKKTLRKILRVAGKYSKYSNSETTEVEILLYVAETILELGLPMHKSTALQNIYAGIIKKIKKSVAGLHEDLQYDYLRQLNSIDPDS
jgi:muconolactone delta-isomerase